MALSLNPAEIDALYTLAVVQMALGDDRAAAVVRPRHARAGAARQRGTAVPDGVARATGACAWANCPARSRAKPSISCASCFVRPEPLVTAFVKNRAALPKSPGSEQRLALFQGGSGIACSQAIAFGALIGFGAGIVRRSSAPQAFGGIARRRNMSPQEARVLVHHHAECRCLGKFKPDDGAARGKGIKRHGGQARNVAGRYTCRLFQVKIIVIRQGGRQRLNPDCKVRPFARRKMVEIAGRPVQPYLD